MQFSTKIVQYNAKFIQQLTLIHATRLYNTVTLNTNKALYMNVNIIVRHYQLTGRLVLVAPT